MHNSNEKKKKVGTLLNNLRNTLDKLKDHPNVRRNVWEIILNAESDFNDKYGPAIIGEYIYYNPLLYTYATIVSRLNNELYFHKTKTQLEGPSLLSQNNAKNIILLSQLNYFFGNMLMNTHRYGNDFSAIETQDDKYLIVLDRNNTSVSYLIGYDDISTINKVLESMRDSSRGNSFFKLKYHNIEAKSNVLPLIKFNFFTMMTSGSLFSEIETIYRPSWHELLYLNQDVLYYDGFIKTWFLENSNDNVTLIFRDYKWGKRLNDIVNVLRKIFNNTKIFLDENNMGELSSFYMKIETWMLYKDIKWNLKLFNEWASNKDGAYESTLMQWSNEYSDISNDEFYKFIKKRLVYIFKIYSEYRLVIKKQLKLYFEKINKTTQDQEKDAKQIFIENILKKPKSFIPL